MKKITCYNVLGPLILFIVTSCASVPSQIDSNLTEKLFFKQAQLAMELDQYNLALYYYEVYLVRYPENHSKVIAAEYEKAMIYYKQKNLKYSKVLFLQILDKYTDGPFAILYPERYKILSEKLLTIIDEKLLPGKKQTPYLEE